MQRPYHIVVWGASGFTGRLVCEHIARDYKGIKFAMAGRNEAKLSEIRDALAAQYGEEFKMTPILIGSLDDAASLDKIASQTSVVISTAGPFALHGTPIVEAVLRQSCDGYADITGEVPWVKQLIQDHHEEAARKGVRIVPCCGYDSVPSDVGTYVVVKEMQQRFGQQPVEVVNAMMGGAGGVSGGTVATAMLQMGSRNPTAANANSVYALVPDGAQPGTDKDFWGTEYNELLGAWLGPFIMQVCNTRIVQRSNYLLGWGGPALRYREGTKVPSWLAGFGVAAGTVAVGAAMSQPWLHPLLRRLLPAPGEGPTRDQMMVTGHWRHRVVGVSKEGSRVAVEVGDKHRDAGYWGTARMLLEAALCIALQKADLEADEGLVKGGVLTPASALGGVFVGRLRAAGLTVEVKDAQAAGEGP